MREIPPQVAAILSALHFQGADSDALRKLTDAEWEGLFSRWEISRLLIPLSRRYPYDIPNWVALRIEQNLADNAERFERIKNTYASFAGEIGRRGGEHLVIKGFALWPDFIEHPRLRLQSDIDVYCPPESVPLALDSLVDLGYEPMRGINFSVADHAPTMVSKAPWTWRGNPYDPDIPVSFEVHVWFWNEQRTRLRVEGLNHFWQRRIERRLENLAFPALASPDSVGYIALNVLRDLLFGSPPAIHLIYGLAQFLETNADNDHFWKDWRELHHDSLRRLELISFRLAAQCFGCHLPEILKDDLARLPRYVQTWFGQFKATPLRTNYHPNKEVLWLHLAALNSPVDRRSILWRTLFPTRIPSADAPWIDKSTKGPGKSAGSLRKRGRYLVYLAKRVIYHLGVLPSTLWHGVQFWWSATEWDTNFLTFLAASFLFNLGMYIFYFLYSLYLVDRGFKENFIGTIASAAMLGGLAGTLPAGILLQRLGLRKVLLLCLGLVASISALRSVFVSAIPLVALAFLAGFAAVMWAVSLSPAVAQLTTEKNRTLGFSIVVFCGIGMGIVGGYAGGRLPQCFTRVHPELSAAAAKEGALLLACGITALAVIPASKLRFRSQPAPEAKIFLLTPFLCQFLVAIGIWSAAIGIFTPFFSLYFSRYWQMPLKQIGIIDSISHVPQLIAIVVAPLLFKKLGLINGAVATQIATAIGLAFLACASGPSSATLIYMVYVAFQWMSEPAIFSLLMNNVEPQERAGASALNFLVVNLSQSIATFAAGASFLRFGYPAVLYVAAGMTLIAALSFRLLLGRPGIVSAHSQRTFEL